MGKLVDESLRLGLALRAFSFLSSRWFDLALIDRNTFKSFLHVVEISCLESYRRT
jgi:hypothetical protein